SAKTLTSPRAYRDPAWLLINPRLLLTNERLRYIVDLSDERRYDDMTSEAFAQGWPGARGGKRHGRRCGPENWFFSREGHVRLALLRLLAEEPRNGYQLMQAIEERSEGVWRPSPGSVYPTLAQLE